MVIKSTNVDSAVSIPAGGAHLRGDLAVPEQAGGLVVFAHGSGSSRLSPRNKYVASVLYNAGLATLLIDLLTPEEEQVDARTAKLRFDVEMLGDRLVEMIDWLVVSSETKGLKIGLFGASTGAAAAILAATRRDKWVEAVVSRGGRPDLAVDALTQLLAPTLLIVGSEDLEVLNLNRQALALIPCTKQLAIVKGATHLFEEPGTLEQAAMLAQEWFARYLK
jgi:putative phosphoribosyl transferase